jgi:outer membrane biosynthesis protein TonB
MILTLVLLGAILPFHRRLKKTLPAGVLGLIYLGLYGVGRFLLSYYRTDPAVFAGLRQAQLASLLMAVIAVVAMPILFQRRGSMKPAEVVVSEEKPVELEPVAAVTQPVEPVEPVVTGPEPAAEAPVAAAEAAIPEPVRPRRPRKPRAPEAPTPAPTPTDSTEDDQTPV